MKKLPAFAFTAVVAAALAGTAIAASPKTHVMNVPLPDRSIARVEYVGNVAPKVTVVPVPGAGDFWMSGIPAFPAFPDMSRIFEDMNRRMRAIDQMARQPAGVPGMNVASYGNLPAGTSSVSVISTSNGGVSCTRTTEVVSQGPGKPPKVTTNVSGNCGAAGPPGQPVHPPAAGPIDRT